MKRTPLYNKHKELGAKLIDFGGWELPVQYEGIIEEHNHVRNAAGIFDVSHMGEITVKGSKAFDFVQRMITNDLSSAQYGQVIYSPMCYPDGGTVDDLLVYKRGSEDYLLVVNAANTDKDFEWLTSQNKENASLENVSPYYAQLAVQGPKAQSIVQKICNINLDEIRFYRFKENVSIGGVNTLISRTGYTGEDGFEIYCAGKDAQILWDELLKADEGVLKPIGLGARDTLRFEAALPLYGHELSEDISPVEAGLAVFVKPDKGEFIGREALAAQKSNGTHRKLIGFEMTERGIPRNQLNVSKDGTTIGFVTSGSFSPSLGKTFGLAMIDTRFSEIGIEIDIVIRDKPVKAKVVKKPFYNKKYAK